MHTLSDYQKKQNALKLLQKKALDKNPEEFHFHMTKAQLKGGVHYDIRDDDKELTADEMKLMQSQDINYIQRKRMIEMNKIERLKQSLHLIDCEDKPKNKHIFFVDNESEKKRFNFAERMKIDEKLLKLGFNVANCDKFGEQKVTEADIEEMAYLRNKSYKELAKRMERLKFLDILYKKMDVKRKLISQVSIMIANVCISSVVNGIEFAEQDRKKAEESEERVGH